MKNIFVQIAAWYLPLFYDEYHFIYYLPSLKIKKNKGRFEYHKNRKK